MPTPSHRTVTTAQAPASPALSQAMRHGGLLLTSGQVGLLPRTSQPPQAFTDEVHQTIDNLCAVLEAADGGLEHVLKTTCYLSDLALLEALNEVYEQRFAAPRPARSTVQAGLVGRFRAELECVAVAA